MSLAMAITQCSECGGKLSTTAPVCPHCGAPPGVALKNLPGETKPLPPVMEESPQDSIPAREPEPVANFICAVCGVLLGKELGDCPQCGATADQGSGKAKPAASMGISRRPPMLESPKGALRQESIPGRSQGVSKGLLSVSFILGAGYLVFALVHWGLFFGVRYVGMYIYTPWISDILYVICHLVLPISIVLLAIAVRKHMSQARLGVLVFAGAAMLLSGIAIFIYFRYPGLWGVTLFKMGFWVFLIANIVAPAVALIALGQMHSGRWPMSIGILAAVYCLSRVAAITMNIIFRALWYTSEDIMGERNPWLPNEWMISVGEFAGPGPHEWMSYFSTANWLFFILALGVAVLLLNWKCRSLPQKGDAM